MDSVFKAIADPTRREILTSLAQKPSSVNELSEKFNMTRQGVTKHIKLLEKSQLISVVANENDQRQRICYAQLTALNQVQDYIIELENYWKGRLKSLGNYLDTVD